MLLVPLCVCVPLCSSSFGCPFSWSDQPALGWWYSWEIWQWVACVSHFHTDLCCPLWNCCPPLCFHCPWSWPALRSSCLNIGFSGTVCVTWSPQARPPPLGSDAMHWSRGLWRVSVTKKNLKPRVVQKELFLSVKLLAWLLWLMSYSNASWACENSWWRSSLEFWTSSGIYG